jgi:hypothetical protein
MDIKDILDNLGLDLSDPETKRGAIEAIDAILASRNTNVGSSGGAGAGAGGGQDTIDIEIDPDLIQPSIKNNSSTAADDDYDIDDEENLLDQVKHNENDDPNEDNSATQGTDDTNGANTGGSNENNDSSSDDNSSNSGSDNDNEFSDSENSESSNNSNDTDTDGDGGDDGKGGDDDSDGSTIDDDKMGQSKEQSDVDDEADTDAEDFDDEEDDFDLDDILDKDSQNTYKDADLKAKENARRIKRERTLQAAKNALSKAVSKKANTSLIKNLEKAIADLESLQEAANKKLTDISDDEFNLLINRVFDAIDALGDSDLTYSTDEERQLKAQEIKTDISSEKTQTELSAEDIAQIRAETQAVKARNNELNKNKPRSRNSFKGFQDFLNSLYRAVALQVKVNELQDDSWSAINRRYSGTGVLQPGKKINEVPDQKIPVIDFYFDCSGSWTDKDLAIGQKAADMLAEMEADGKIKVNIYYFANNVHSDKDSARLEGGTRAWNEIIKNIIVTNATNVIIMTDSDMEDWWNGPTALKQTVPGYVWYLWRDGENAPRLPRDLKGRGGTQQFSFSHGDI